MTSLVEHARARGVTRLVHFTPARNLPHILDDGALRPVVELRADRQAYFAATDLDRYDGHPDRTCCSIEYPNPYYLRIARSRPTARTYPDWVALLLPIDLLDRPGVLVSPRNAAAGTAVPASLDAFDALYAPAVAGSGGRRYVRGATHLLAAPTDMQAEVLVPGHVGVSQVIGLLFPDIAMLKDVRAYLDQVQRRPPDHWIWRTSPAAFDPDDLRRCIQGGRFPEEHEHA